MTATLQVDHAQEASDPGLTEVEMEMERKVNSHPTFNHSPYTDFEHVRRFLAARNRDVDAAYAMWEKWATWHASYQPENIKEEEVRHLLEVGKITMHGTDKGGRGVLYVRLMCHEPDAAQTANTVRAAVYCIEKAIATSKASGGDGFMTVLWDHQGCGWRNFDAGLLTGKGGLISILQEFYPERLFAVHIVHADWIFWALWKLVSPFIDDRTRHKIVLVKAATDLRAAFNADQLPAIYREQVYGKLTSSADDTSSAAPQVA